MKIILLLIGIIIGFVIGYLIGIRKHTQIQKGGADSIQIQIKELSE